MALPTSVQTSTTMVWPQSQLQPAYNSVPARTLLSRTQAPMAEATSPAKPQKVEWSPAVREYVGRAFDPESAIDGITKDDVTAKLKEVIGYFAERSQLESVDWKGFPLPQQIIREERDVQNARALASAAPSLNGGDKSTTSETPSSKKRKSQDKESVAQAADMSTPPWRRTNLEDRITYSNARNDKRHKKNALAGDSSSKFDQADLEKRKQRFQLGKAGTKHTSLDSDSDMNTDIIVGTCTSLEKQYLRLTAPPKPDTVRPQHVLEKTLSMLWRKWKTEKNYNYTCNQFKSLRQDLTVQHIKNDFTVKVYESHARIALEKGDLGEYNQCQTQLKALYLQKLGGNPDEFTAYRILYFVYTGNKTDMNDLLAELTPADKVQPYIKHALDVRSSVALGNYHRFFKLYLDAPNMGRYLMDMFIERERLHALANISKAYMAASLRFLTDELSFDTDNACCEFFTSHGAQHLIEETIDVQGRPQLRAKLKEGAPLFEGLRKAAFARVDIKGQI